MNRETIKIQQKYGTYEPQENNTCAPLHNTMKSEKLHFPSATVVKCDLLELTMQFEPSYHEVLPDRESSLHRQNNYYHYCYYYIAIGW